jgi:hypothetical protein
MMRNLDIELKLPLMFGFPAARKVGITKIIGSRDETEQARKCSLFALSIVMILF